jgi:2-polyprenyl-3-methyl-5-hydroxy-6-metoxy-1,4-benzoquinol methylase
MNVHRLDDTPFVRRVYASLERPQMQCLDRIGWVRFDGLDEEQTLLAVAARHPVRVLDAACGVGRAPSSTGPEVICVDGAEAPVEAARA